MIDKIICAGFGGQGVMSIGRLIAYTGMKENLEVSWLPSYGPEMRGGTANCHVLVSDTPIGSPIISHDATLVIAMNLPSLVKFQDDLTEGGVLMYNSSLIDPPKLRDDITPVPVPANDKALELGNLQSANMIMLGAYIGLRKMLPIESVVSALEKVFGAAKAHLLPGNKQALYKGLELTQGTGVK